MCCTTPRSASNTTSSASMPARWAVSVEASAATSLWTISSPCSEMCLEVAAALADSVVSEAHSVREPVFTVEVT